MTIAADTRFYVHRTQGHYTYRTPEDGDRYPVAGDYRPVVVIDPEDREQVERLCSGLLDIHWYGNADAMQVALRKFANPTPPKPDEPTGLGAVVEDADGIRWVLAGQRLQVPDHWRPAGWLVVLMGQHQRREGAQRRRTRVVKMCNPRCPECGGSRPPGFLMCPDCYADWFPDDD
jgi:hypothetical protein